MIDMSRYKGLTNDGKWRGTDADDSVIFEVHDEHGEVADYKTIALVMRDSDHYGTEDNPDIRLMVDAPLLLEEVKRLREWKAGVERTCRTLNYFSLTSMIEKLNHKLEAPKEMIE